MQLQLNELALEQGVQPVTGSAFTQARANLSHSVFVALNQQAVVDVMYSDDNIKRYKGFRLLGIDGSKILLPEHHTVQKAFGEISYSNDHPDVEGAHAYGLASVMYDVLNHVAIDSTLGKARDYEVGLAIGHLAQTQADDLLLCDRNYPSYFFLAALCALDRRFVIRCSAASFGVARQMLNGKGADDQVVTLNPHHTKRAEVQFHDLPEAIKVRFVRVQLDTGEYEVLVTNLLDTQTFPTEEFKTIYHLRWGVEGFYFILKSRLTLENFSGKTAESVLQDFYSAVYLSGLETLLTEDVNAELAEKPTQYPQQVNRAVSFNAIKNQALDLLLSDLDEAIVIERLEQLFRMNPTVLRPERKVPRKKRAARHRLNHAKRKQKFCF